MKITIVKTSITNFDMGNKNINIPQKDVINAYNNANKEQKEMLENLFGKDFFKPQDITERIKTFEDALNILGEGHQLVKEFRYMIDMAADTARMPSWDLRAYIKLRIIVTALNEGWKPQFIKGEKRWTVWYDLITKEHYDKLSEEDKHHCILLFGNSPYVKSGFAYVYAGYSSSITNAYFGALLTFKSEKLAAYASKQFAKLWISFCFQSKAK